MSNVSCPLPCSLRIVRLRGVRVQVESVPLTAVGCVIGSGSLNEGDVYIDPRFCVAPCHARVDVVENVWCIRLCDTRVTCVVNGVKLAMGAAIPLTPGTVVEVGFVTLAVEALPFENLHASPSFSHLSHISPLSHISHLSHISLPSDFAGDHSSPVASGLSDIADLSNIAGLAGMDGHQEISSLQNPSIGFALDSTSSEVDTEASEQFISAGQALVDVLQQDLRDEYGESLFDGDEPLIGNPNGEVWASVTSSSATSLSATSSSATSFQRETAFDPGPTDDVLEQLAHESELVLRGLRPDPAQYVKTETQGGSAAHSGELSTASLSGAPLANSSSASASGGMTPDVESLLDLLGTTDVSSLGDLLEGPLSIDDVLLELEEASPPPLLETVPCDPDPLHLLAGTAPEIPLSRLTPVLRHDHHLITVGSPYRQVGKTSSVDSDSQRQQSAPRCYYQEKV